MIVTQTIFFCKKMFEKQKIPSTLVLILRQAQGERERGFKLKKIFLSCVSLLPSFMELFLKRSEGLRRSKGF